MTAMTYTSLQTTLKNYLERGSNATQDPVFIEELPNLIGFAERRIALELNIQGMIQVVSGNFQANTAVYDKPDRWHDTISWSFGTGTAPDYNTRNILLTRSYEYLGVYWPDRTQTDTPLFYADYDVNHWLVAPTPDAAYPFEIVYYEVPELLSEAVQTNWFTENAPQLLLYASLLEAAPFLKNDERIPVWQSMYDRTAAMLNGEDLKKIMDRSAVREGA